MTSTELGYLSGVTSNIQTQLDGKALSDHSHAAINEFTVAKGDNEDTEWAEDAGGTCIAQWSHNYASMQFREVDNNTSSVSGKYFNIVADGWFYQNEGRYNCIDTSGGHIIGQETKNTGVLRIDSPMTDGRNILLTNTKNLECSIRFCKTSDSFTDGFVIGYKAGSSAGIGVWSDALKGNIIQFLDTGILLNSNITYGSSFPSSPVSGQLYFLKS